MRSSAWVVAGLLLAAPPAVELSQAQTEVVVAPVVVTGEVIRYEPGRLLVVRSDGRELSYNLTPSITVPGEVQVGRTVNVHTEPGREGATAVTRVTSISVTPEGQVKRTTEETRVGAGGEVRTKTTTVTGEVVSFVPGRSIVIRREGAADLNLALAPSAAVPAEVQVGQKVTLHTEPGPGGATTVSRVMTTTVTPEGQIKRTTEETRTQPSGESTKTTTVTIQGKVQAYMPGKSITLIRSDGSRATYTIAEGTPMPSDIPVGKTVTIRTVPSGNVETIIIDKD